MELAPQFAHHFAGDEFLSLCLVFLDAFNEQFDVLVVLLLANLGKRAEYPTERRAYDAGHNDTNRHLCVSRVNHLFTCVIHILPLDTWGYWLFRRVQST